MHFENTNGMNSNATSATTTSCPSTSSSDSGVIIIDNQTTINARNNNTSNRNRNNNSNNNANNINIDSATTTTSTTSATTRNDEKLFNETESNRKSFNINKNVENNIKKSSHINIENTINIGNSSRDADSNSNGSNSGSSSGSSNRQPFNDNTRTATTSKNYSPTVSVRSTTISIVSIDENAPDSSIVDSDSDIEADAEGVHSNYIVKKLGQQTTYPANSPDIPALNKGLTVIGQKITPNGTAGAIDDVLASNIRNGGLCAPSSTMAMAGGLTPTTPQIGSIALSNSTDVTFGDKHFYEGPVTIQQFLIDNGRDKWKANDSETGGGQDNPAFGPEQNAKDGSCGAGASGGSDGLNERPYKFIFHRKAVIITGTIIILTILVGICIVIGTNLSKSSIPKSKLPGDGDDLRKHIPINSNIADSDDCGVNELCVVRREGWQGRPAKAELTKLDLPVNRIIISHTVSDYCYTQDVCNFRVQIIQNFHMDSWNWDDIGYNFLIGGDGRVYVGRSWLYQGAHTKGYNSDSYGISLIGTFTTLEPTEKQLRALKLLIEEGVLQHKIAPNYRLYGARQMGATESPDKDNIGGGSFLRIVARDAWLAQPPNKDLVPLDLPVPNVIVLPTNTDICTTQASCTFRVRFTQTFNIESLQNDDIIYNFLIGGDGNVYEGRGWDKEGAHLKGFNDHSISVAYIGTFKVQKPTDKQMNVTKLLLSAGVAQGKLQEDYKIYGANNLDPSAIGTVAPALYASFKDWPHWTEKT